MKVFLDLNFCIGHRTPGGLAEFLKVTVTFTIYFFMFHTYCVIFSDDFALFLAQNFKIKVLTTQKI